MIPPQRVIALSSIDPKESSIAPSRAIPSAMVRADRALPLAMKGDAEATISRASSAETVAIDPEAYRKALQLRIEQAGHYPVEAIRRRWQGMTLMALLLYRDGIRGSESQRPFPWRSD